MEKTLRNPRQAGSQIGLEDISLTSILRDLMRNILLILLIFLLLRYNRQVYMVGH